MSWDVDKEEFDKAVEDKEFEWLWSAYCVAIEDRDEAQNTLQELTKKVPSTLTEEDFTAWEKLFDECVGNWAIEIGRQLINHIRIVEKQRASIQRRNIEIKLRYDEANKFITSLPSDDMRIKLDLAESMAEAWETKYREAIKERDTFEAERNNCAVSLAVSLCGEAGPSGEVTRKIWEQGREIITERDHLKTLLRVAKCPECDGSGGIPVQVSEDDWEEQQCRWCFERNMAVGDQ